MCFMAFYGNIKKARSYSLSSVVFGWFENKKKKNIFFMCSAKNNLWDGAW